MNEQQKKKRKLKETQSGYGKDHSKNTVAITLTYNILKVTNTGEITLTVMAGYSKAYEILITKLHLLKFSKQALQLIVHTDTSTYNSTDNIQIMFLSPTEFHKEVSWYLLYSRSVLQT